MRLLERVLHSKTKDQLVLVSLGKPKRTNPNFFLIEELFGFVFFILNSIQARLGVFTPRLACAYADLSAAYVFIMFFLPFFKFSFAFFAFKEGLVIREEASCECFQFVFQSESRNGLHLLSRLFFYSLPFLSLSGNSATSFNTESLLSPYSMLFSKVLLSAEGKTTIGDQNSTIILLTSRFLVVIAGNAGLSRGAICLLSYNILAFEINVGQTACTAVDRRRTAELLLENMIEMTDVVKSCVEDDVYDRQIGGAEHIFNVIHPNIVDIGDRRSVQIPSEYSTEIGVVFP